jgi:hypothetical protein
LAQGSTEQASNREFMANFGLTSTTGAGLSNGNGDKVALYTGVVANAGTGNVWSYNGLVAQNAGSGTYDAQIIEADLNNFNVDRGGSDGPTGLPATVANGISISGTNDTNGYQNTADLALDSFGAVGGTGLFAHAVTVAGTFKYNEWADYGVAPTVFALFGGHTYGLDCYSASLSGGCVRMATNSAGGIIGRNAANTADANIIRFDGNNTLICETNCNGTYVNSGFVPLTTNVYLLGAPTAQWAAAYIGVVNAATNVFVNGVSVATGTGTPGQCAQFITAQQIISTGSPCGSGGGGGGGGSGTVDPGASGEVAWYPADGSAVAGSSFLNIVGSALGVNTTVPSATLTVNGTGSFSGNVAVSGAFAAAGTVTFSALGSGCLQAGSGGVVTSTGSACGSGGGGGPGPVNSVTAGSSGNITSSPTTGSVVVDLVASPHVTSLGVGTSTIGATLTVSGSASVSGAAAVGGAATLSGSVQMSALTTGTPATIVCQDASFFAVSCGGTQPRAIPNVFAAKLTVDTGTNTATISDGGTLAVAGTSTLSALAVNGPAAFGTATLFSSTVQMTSLSGGAPSKYLCLDASNLLVASASPC